MKSVIGLQSTWFTLAKAKFKPANLIDHHIYGVNCHLKGRLLSSSEKPLLHLCGPYMVVESHLKFAGVVSGFSLGAKAAFHLWL